MAKSSNYEFIKLIFVITLISAITITVGIGTILYQKTWSTDRGSELKIEVTPNSASFQPDKRLGEAAQAGYWPLDHEAFNDIKDFLKKLHEV